MKKIIAALISLTLFYSSTVCIFAIENQECPYYEEIADVIELKKGPVLYLNEKRNDTYWEFSDNEEASPLKSASSPTAATITSAPFTTLFS